MQTTPKTRRRWLAAAIAAAAAPVPALPFQRGRKWPMIVPRPAPQPRAPAIAAR